MSNAFALKNRFGAARSRSSGKNNTDVTFKQENYFLQCQKNEVLYTVSRFVCKEEKDFIWRRGWMRIYIVFCFISLQSHLRREVGKRGVGRN